MRYILIAILVLFTSQVFVAQCSFELDSDINAGNSGQYEILVSGLSQEDLATNQSVCGVRVNFAHPSVVNLRMTLTSPDGQSVFLIGPATASSSISSFVQWDVEFVDCGQPVSPDPGIPDTWNNTSPWTNAVTYTGTYFPNGGCLSDFNMGSANGVWTLTVDDLGENFGGELFEVELIFCDPAGLACTICDTQVVNFDDSSAFFCEEQVILFDINRYFTTQTSAFIDEYIILVQSDQIVGVFMDDEVSSTLAQGIYEVYGVAVTIGTDMSTFATYSSLIEALTDGSLCGDSSDNNGFINILEVEEVMVVQETLCAGEPYEVAGTILSAPIDTTVYTLGTSGTCEIQFDVILTLSESGLAIQQTNQNLDCGEEVVLTATPANPNLTYNWATVDGSIVNGANAPIVVVNQPGTYYLYGDGDCVAADSITIAPAQNFGQVNIAIQSSDCASTTATLSLESDLITIDDFYWQGPGIDGSTSGNPMITQNGTYSAVVFSDDFSCDSIIVYQSYQSISTSTTTLVKQNDIDCIMQSTMLFVQTDSEDILDVEWTDMTGVLVGKGLSVEVGYEGTFTATVIFTNGCQETYDITVVDSGDLYSIVIQPTPLECATQEGALEVFTDGPVESIVWNGPFGFASTDAMTIISTVGTYRVTITYIDGCVLTLTQYMDYNPTTSPVVNIPDQIINCIDTCVDLEPSVGDDPNYCYQWFGPSGFNTQERTPEVCVPGRYRVQINSSSDCSSLACFSEYNIFVILDTFPPEIIVDFKELNCGAPNTKLEITSDVSRIGSFLWTGPGIDATNENSLTPVVSVGGDYTIAGLGTNGCDFEHTFTVAEDVTPIDISNDGATFGSPCAGGDVQVMVESQDDIVLYNWSVPNQNGSTLNVNTPGDYSVTVTGSNFCTAEATYTVTQDDLFSLSVTDDIVGLGCITMEAGITVTLLDNDPLSGAIIQSIEAVSTVGTAAAIGTTMPSASADLIFNESGEYMITALLDNGCELQYSVTVDAIATPIEPELDIPTVNCINQDQIIYSVLNPTSFTSIDWSIDGTSVSTDADYMPTDPLLTVDLTVSDINGCASNIEIIPTVEIAEPSLEVMMDNSVDCQVILTANSTENVGYTWSTTDGSILSGLNDQSVTIDALGTYTIVIESLDNGCDASQEIVIDALTSSQGYEVILSEPQCGEDFVSILDVMIDNTSIDTDQFSILLDDAPLLALPADISGVGLHDISLISANGCVNESNFNVEVFEPFTISIQDTFAVEENDPITTQVAINSTQPLSDFLVEWSDNPVIDTENSAIYTISTPGDFTVQVTDSNGCVNTASFFIKLKPSVDVFVSNIFQLGLDGPDGELLVSAPNSSAIAMSVYDRWGNEVYNGTSAGREITWNGLLGSEPVEQGVYVVTLEVLFTDGDTLRQVYDVTVIK